MTPRLSFRLVAIACACATRASAAGLSIPDLGANALGQGAASIAAPEDPTAVYYNPGALAFARGLHFVVDLRRTSQQLSFQRLDDAGNNPDGWAKVENTGGASLAPLALVSYQFEPKGLIPFTISGGLYPSSGYSGYQFPDPIATLTALGGKDFAEDASRATPQRYALISQNSVSITGAIAVAAQVRDWLGLGFTLQIPYYGLHSKQAISASKAAFPDESIGWDAVLKIDTTGVALNGAFGASFKLPWGLAAGLALQLPTTVVTSGTLQTELGYVLESVHAKQVGNQADVELHVPWIVRAGLRLVQDAFEVEGAFTFDGWSRYDEVVVKPHDIAIEQDGNVSKLTDIHLPKNLQNSQSYRLGGLWKIGRAVASLDGLSLRAGLVYETSAVPAERVTLDLAHWQRLATNAGLGYAFGAFEVVVAYAHFFQPDLQVRTSEVKQARTGDKSKYATILANGDYSTQIDVLALSVTGKFGAESR